MSVTVGGPCTSATESKCSEIWKITSLMAGSVFFERPGQKAVAAPAELGEKRLHEIDI